MEVIKKTVLSQSVQLRFFQIGSEFQEIVAAPDLLTAIKEAAYPGYGDDWIMYLEDCGDDLEIKELSYEDIKDKIITDFNVDDCTQERKRKVSTIVKNAINEGSTSFLVYSIGYF